MATAADMIEVFEQMDFMAIAADAMRSTSKEYLDYNRRQMMEGKGRTKNIGRYRNAGYARMKNEMSGLAGLGNVDLRLTGSFQDKMTFEVAGDEINIDSTDDKSADLVSKYGEGVFGLNPGTKNEYTDEILQPAFVDIVGKVTGLKSN